MSRWRPLPVTGRDVVSVTGFLILLPYSVTTIFLANPDLEYARPVTLIVLAIAAQVLLFLLLVIWRWLLNSWELLASGVAVVIAFTVISLIRAVTLSLALDFWGVTPGVDWGTRLPGAVIGYTAALVIIDGALGALRRHRQQAALLRRRQEQARRTRVETLQAIADERASVFQRIHNLVVERLRDIDGGDPQTAVDALRAIAAEVVHPMSRMLADAAPKLRFVEPNSAPSRFQVRAFLADATRGRPLSPLLTTVLFLAFTIPFCLINFNPGFALLVTVIAGVLTYTTLMMSNAIYTRVSATYTIPARLALLALLVVASCALVVLPSLLLFARYPDLVYQIMLASAALLVVLSITAVCAHGARQLDQRIVGQLEEAAVQLERASARAHCLNWQEHRSLARAMHGPVQNAIWGAVLQLERSLERGNVDPELLGELQAQVLDSLVLSEGPSQSGKHVTAALEALALTWAGACDISWVIEEAADAGLAADPLASFAAREITTEACWNAIRHGHATSVRADLALVDTDTIRVLVVDNGAVEPPSSALGVGTAMIQDMSLCWERTREGGLTTFQADIALEVGPPGESGANGLASPMPSRAP